MKIISILLSIVCVNMLLLRLIVHRLSYDSVSFPFLEPLLRHIVKFMEIKRAAEYLEKSATKMIEARLLEQSSSLVSVHLQMGTYTFLLYLLFGFL